MAKFKKDNLWFSQNVEILSDAKSLTISDKQQQFLDPNGLDRNVFMVTEATASGLSFWIINSGTTGNLLIKNSAGNQDLLTISTGQIGYLTCNGTIWNCSVGSTGATGGTGAQGIRGEAGDQGVQGPTGGTGGQGIQGEAGDQGVQGPTGGTGGQGIQGEAGDEGPIGPTGGTGDIGVQGPRGEGFNIDEFIPDFGEDDIVRIEEISGITSEDVYIITIFDDNRSNQSMPVGIAGDMSKHIIMHDGVTWYDWGKFIGDTGGTGAQGGTGSTGATGNTGEVGATLTGGTGAQGDPGDEGPIGPTGGTGGIGSVGPIGDTGSQGEPGSTGGTGGVGVGEQGPIGPTGGTGAAGDLDSNLKLGNISLSSGISSIVVNFGVSFANNNYSIGYSLINTTDSSPSSYTSVITAKSESGFTITLSGQIDSSNYILSWLAII